jgi:hypothetical protein
MATPTNSEELFRQATQAWQSAADAGVKMQEECAQWGRQVFCESSTLTDWYDKGQKLMSEAITRGQENVDDAIHLMNQQAESSLKLVRKALEIRDAEPAGDGPSKLAGWWQAALETMRINNQAVLAANSRILSNWSDMACKVNGDAANTMAELAKKTSEHAERIAKVSMEHAQESVERVHEMAK